METADKPCTVPADTIRKVLLLRFSSLGDIVMTTPMIRCVRRAFPKAQIDMVVRSDFQSLVACNHNLDNVIAFPRNRGLFGLLQLVRRLNREHYDLIYDAHLSLRTLFVMPLLRTRTKIRFDKHYLRRSLALTFKLPLLRDSRRLLERFIDPLMPFGVCYDGAGPEVFVSHRWVSEAEKKLGERLNCWKPGNVTIGIIPSAQWPGKRWPSERFRAVLRSVVDNTPTSIIIFGGPNDLFCRDIADGLPQDRVLNTQGLLTLGQSMAVLLRCQLVVANDTGLMHVSDALGIPSVLILGPTSGELGCLPFHRLSRVLEHSLWCRPCSKNGQAPCIRGHRVCLKRTTPEEVVLSIQSVVDDLARGRY